MAVKRLLSIDGGGIRGVMAAAILARIEEDLQSYDPRLKSLSDFFDLIGGTSTGSILAAGLAKGMSAKELCDIYKDIGGRIFQHRCPARWPIIGNLFTKYNPRNLEDELEKNFSDLTIGSQELKTKLSIITKNVTLGRVNVFSNIENNPLFQEDPHVKLRDIIRASAAAPTFFPPHTFKIDHQSYEFIDGGVSMYNNPSFQVFLQATQPEWGLNWPSDVDNLLLVSIGTGFSDAPLNYGEASKYKAIGWAKYIIPRLMDDANLQQNRLLKLISFQPNKWSKKDKKVIYTPKEFSKPEEYDGKLFTYFRFTTSFTQERFEDLHIENSDSINIREIEKMDCVDQIDELERIGNAVAKEQFSIDRFKRFI